MSPKGLNDIPSGLTLNRQVASFVPLRNEGLPSIDKATESRQKRVTRKAFQVVGVGYSGRGGQRS